MTNDESATLGNPKPWATAAESDAQTWGSQLEKLVDSIQALSEVSVRVEGESVTVVDWANGDRELSDEGWLDYSEKTLVALLDDVRSKRKSL